VNIVVLMKPVPDTTGQERLLPDGRVDRAASAAVVNANDEYAIEAALKLTEAHGGEVTLLAMAPANGPETMRKALAMGATRGVHVTDPVLEGSDTLSTTRVLAAALAAMAGQYDLVFAGADTSDGAAGIVPAGIAALLGLPYLSYAAKIEPQDGRVRVRRISPTGYDVIEALTPALVVCTQVLGEPRYPSLKGIMAARSREIAARSLADLGLDATGVGGGVATTRVTGSRPPAARGATEVVRGPAEESARRVVDFLASRRII
jgi:electron transfer flavoprotein beta subunit